MRTIELGRLSTGTESMALRIDGRDPAFDLTTSGAQLDSLLRRNAVTGTGSVSLPDIRTARSVAAGEEADPA